MFYTTGMYSVAAWAEGLVAREEPECDALQSHLPGALDPDVLRAQAEAAAAQAPVAHDGTALTTLLLAIETFLSAPTLELTQYELGQHLIQLRHGIDLLEVDFSATAAIFADTNEYDLQGSTTAIDWIRHQCRMSGHAAARAVAAGDQMHRLPLSVAALDAGEIGFAHFSLLAGTARALEGVSGSCLAADRAHATDPSAPGETSLDAAASPADPSTLRAAPAFDERVLLELAKEHSVGRFGHDCTHARHAKDAASVLEEHVSAAERNDFTFIPCSDGRTAVRGIFDNVAAATLQTVVVAFAKPTGFADERPRGRRFADALVEIASHALDRGGVGERRAHLQLTASVETVQGLEGAPGGELEFAGAVPAATVQRLACDARIRRILLGPTSAVIDVGRAQRLPGPGARAALRTRASGGCEWPGCERSVAFTNAHHLVHWGHGGGTDLANLVLLCHRHHWLIHEGGWQLARQEDGLLLAIPPSRTHRSWIRPPVGTGAG
jgi:Domain of unknown function (DUF222)